MTRALCHMAIALGVTDAEGRSDKNADQENGDSEPKLRELIDSWLSLAVCRSYIPKPTDWRGIQVRKFPTVLENIEDQRKLSLVRLIVGFIVAFALVGFLIFFFAFASENHKKAFIPPGTICFILTAGVVLRLQKFRSKFWQYQSLKWLEQFDFDVQQYIKKSILQALRTRKVKEPADKVFALHGVLDLQGVEHKQPNYTKDVETVYKDFFISLRNWYPSLKLLIDAGLSNTHTGPFNFDRSWVPNFYDASERSWLDISYVCTDLKPNSLRMKALEDRPSVELRGIQGVHPQELVEDLSFYSATPASTMNYELQYDSKILVVSGYPVPQASVSSVCQLKLAGSSYTCKELFEVTESLCRWIGVTGIALQRNQGAVQIEQTLFQILSATTGTPPKVGVIHTWLSWLISISIQLAESKNSPDITIQLMADMHENHQDVWNYHENVCTGLAQKRVLCTIDTSYGGLLATGSPATGVGDKVALVCSVDVPLAIRMLDQDENVYQLVGPMFIPGMMRGQFWDERNLSSIRLR
jgi:hypothetical protein